MTRLESHFMNNKQLVDDIDKLVEDIQVSSVLSNNKLINKIFSEKIIPVLFEIKTNLEISNPSQIEFKEKINYCVATTSDIVDLNSEYSVFYSRIRILRENILTKIK
ncbi:MAG: hypothetical protein MK083_00295 [Dehalococcoidia bacterium]|nr:hypothetical protein [Dehalococcoidia bacterium]|tara:strand:- start:77 stop:397 length:321 start_codon:yes stop_codon:yes gene_type:complete